jgi:hypothetical protein
VGRGKSRGGEGSGTEGRAGQERGREEGAQTQSPVPEQECPRLGLGVELQTRRLRMSQHISNCGLRHQQ